MKKHKMIYLCAMVLLVLLASFIALKWDSIFQRGNPVPYLTAAVKLSDERTYVEVANMPDIYITKRGEKQDLFQMIQDRFHVEFKDQLGSSYLFTDGEKNYTVGSEIYWGRFTVWTLSFDEGFPK